MKNFLNKFITASLCVILVLTSFVFVSADSISSAEIEDVSILKQLGLLPAGFEERLSEPATRGDAADLFATLYDVSGTHGKLFDDVDETTSQGKSVSVLHAQGIVNGNGKGSFLPNDAITSEALVSMAVRALGGELYAGYNGGYPMGYSKALTAVFGMRMPANNTITVSELISFFRATIDSDVMRQSIFGATDNFGLYEGETLLKQQKNIIKMSGIMTGNRISGLYYADANNETGIIVDGVSIQNTQNEIDELLGYHVDVYYQENTNDEKIALAAVKSDNKELVLDEETDAVYNNKEYTYYLSDNKKTAAVGGEGFALIYNGVSVTDMKDEYFALNNGDVTLIDNNDDGIYNIVKVNSYASYVAEEISENAIVYKNGGHLDLSLKETKYKFFDAEGNEILYSDIAEGTVVSVFISADKKFIKGICTSNETTGILGRTKAENGKEIWTIDDKEYIVLNKTLTDVKSGMRVTVKLDYKGKIAYASVWDSEYYFYAYLGICAQSGGLDDSAVFMMFDDDGSIRQVESREKIKIDGIACNGYDAIAAQLDKTAEEAEIYTKNLTDSAEIDTLRSSSAIGQMVRYKTDKNGYVSEIDTAAPNMGDDYKTTLHLSEFGESTTEKISLNNLGMIGKSLAYNSETTFLWVPSDMSDKDDFYVDKGGKSITNKQKYNAVGYYTDGDMVADYVLIKTDGEQKVSTSEWSRISVVSQKAVTLNEDGEEIEMISYYEYASNGYRELTAMENTSGVLAGIEVGDVIRCALYNGKISTCDKVYDCSEDMIMNTKGAYTDYLHLFGGSVYDKKNGVIAATAGKIVDADAITDFNLYNLEKFRIMTVDYSRDVYISQGNSADIRNYTEYTNDCSQVIIQMVDYQPMTMIVINR